MRNMKKKRWASENAIQRQRQKLNWTDPEDTEGHVAANILRLRTTRPVRCTSATKHRKAL